MRYFKLSVLLASSFLSLSQNAFALSEAASTVNAEYVKVSAVTPLKPKQKIADLFKLNQMNTYILQRLTARTYFFQKQSYATTFYVGDHGVLVFDPIEGGGDALLKAIQEVTPLPVTALVYSHAHYDHLGDAGLFLKNAKKNGVKLRIISSQASAQKLAYIHSELPRPNEIVSWPYGKFKFENLTVQLHGFKHAAHTDDHAVWLLEQEKVLHAADQMNPDQLPFWNFGGSENYLYYIDNLKQASALNWNYVNAGHGNVGSKDDYHFYLVFLEDLEKATTKAMKNTPWGINIDPLKVNNHAAYMVEWHKAISKTVTDELRPIYGKYYGFEYTVPYNADMVLLRLTEYR